MNIRGKVENGVVVLDDGPPLPEGTVVTVSYPDTPKVRRRRVELPLVPSDRPGSISLTAERVAELLDNGDVSA